MRTPLFYLYPRSLTLAVCFIWSSVCLAEHGGGFGGAGSYHQGNIDQGYHHNGEYGQGLDNQFGGYRNDDDDDYYSSAAIGNYYPGNGYIAPTVILDQDNDNNNCQTVQQCNDNGTCILTQNCN